MRLTIRGWTVRAVSVPIDPPLRNSLNTIPAAPLVVAELQTEEGPAGTGYAFAYAPAALGPLAALVRDIGASLAGEDAAPVPLWDRLQDRFRLLGTEGLVQMALSVLDTALWDARARAAGLPLATLLGGRPEPLPAYGSLRGWGPAMLAEEGGRAVAGWGVRAVKCKLGAPRLEDDLDTVRALRGAVGDGVEILVDFNQGLTREEALRRGMALAGLGVGWIEEPLPVQDDAGLAWLSARLPMPVQGGENWWGPARLHAALGAGALRLCMPDAMKMGGPTGFLRGAAVAAAHRVPVSSHIFVEASAHLLPVAPTRHWLEWMDLAAPVRRGGFAPVDGTVAAPAGLGLDWDEAALRKFAADA